MKRILLTLLAAIVLFLGYAATLPSTFHVERSITIAAPADSLYPHIVNFREWNAWSPWEKLDPAMKHEFGGTEGSVGATSYWSGNDKVGEGRMTLASMQPPSNVFLKLEFIRPFKSTATATLSLVPDGAGTKATWAMDGPKNYLSKVMCVFMNMDKMMGGDLERGLGNLKSFSEASATP